MYVGVVGIVACLCVLQALVLGAWAPLCWAGPVSRPIHLELAQLILAEAELWPVPLLHIHVPDLTEGRRHRHPRAELY